MLQARRLRLDDPVCKYLPSWNRDDRRSVTVRNLATHTSGLNSYTSAARSDGMKKPGQSNADALIDCIASLPLKYKTNEGHLYACLNLTNTGYYLSDEQKKRCVPTTESRQGIVHDPLAFYYRDGHHCPGNAGLFSSANDLARFCSMLLSNGRYGPRRPFRQRRIMKPETIDMFFTDLVPDDPKYAWGLGWGISTSRPRPASVKLGPKVTAISHTGYTGTAIEIDRYAGTYMIMLTNRVYPNDNTSVGSIRSAVRRVMLETDPIYRDLLRQR